MPPSKNPDWIDWRNSAAREIMLEDLQPGDILYEQPKASAQKLFEYYKHFPEFKKVVFSQLEARLKSYRKNASERVARSRLEAKWLQHDRSIYPRQSKNERGEPVFDLHPEAKKYLERDVKEGKHLQMSAAELQASRNAYRPFKKNIFKDKIRQEERRQKFINYLEEKRSKQRTKFAKERAKKEAKEEVKLGKGKAKKKLDVKYG